MDHIDLPRDRDPFEFTVPLFASDIHKYDGKGFGTFPARCGFDPENIAVNKQPAEVLSFVQAWLYFGTMAEMFGTDFRQEDFVDYDHVTGGVRIDTTLLPICITRRAKLRRWWQKPNKHYQSILLAAHNACENFDRRTLKWRMAGWPRLLMSIRLLLESLQGLALYRLQVQIRLTQPSTRPIKIYLAKKPGWCSHHLHLIEDCGSYHAVLYLANLRRHVKPWVSHGSCWTQDQCVAYNIDNQTFQSKHVSEACHCEHISAPTEDMLQILREDGIPVVRCEYGTDVPRLSYVRASPGARYAAISHLWADGLGNPRANTLPLCQVQRIAEFVVDANRKLIHHGDHMHNLGLLPPVNHMMETLSVLCQRLLSRFEDSPVDFWLDTYCVPIVPVDHCDSDVLVPTFDELRNLKEVALRRMYATYTWAEYTLVLDDELRFLDAESDETEFYARVNLCGWNTRCWTLQEYCLSQRVVFQGQRPLLSRKFKNDFASSEFRSDESNRNVFDQVSKMERQMSRLKWVRGYRRKNAKPNECRFSQVWNSLVIRNTTKCEDLPAIFANLMGLVGWQHEVVQKQDLMKSVLAYELDLPPALLWIKTKRYEPDEALTSTKLRDDRWVPLVPHRSDMFDTVPLAHLGVSGDGLRFPKHTLWSRWHVLEVECPGLQSWVFTIGGLTMFVLFRDAKQRPPQGRVLLVLDQNVDRALSDAGHLQVAGEGCCLLATKEKDCNVHTTYFSPIDWRLSNMPTPQDAEDDENARASVGTVFDFSAHEIHIDADISAWRIGTDWSHEVPWRMKYLGVLVFIILVTGVFMPAMVALYYLLEAIKDVKNIYSGTITIVYVTVTCLLMGLGVGTLFYALFELLDYYRMAQSVPSARGPMSWVDSVKIALPKTKRGVGLWRYYIICSIMIAIIHVHSGWQRLVRVWRGRRTGWRSDDEGGAIRI